MPSNAWDEMYLSITKPQRVTKKGPLVRGYLAYPLRSILNTRHYNVFVYMLRMSRFYDPFKVAILKGVGV